MSEMCFDPSSSGGHRQKKERRRKTTRDEFTGEGTGIAPGRVLSQSPLPGCLQVHWWLSWHALSEQAPVRNFIN